MNIQTIKEKIPHGGYNEICKRTGLNKVTICNYFNGKSKVKPHTENTILKATAEYLNELKVQREKTLFAINQI